MAKKIDCTRSEKRPIARAQNERERECDDKSGRERPPARAEPVEREADPISADAEEHHMREGDDAGIAEQHVVGCDQQDHHARLGRNVERLRAGKEKGRQRKQQNDHENEDLQRPPARRIAREQIHLPLTG